jgi:glycosyltransferase involved in cell wall biosynthesis
MSLKVSVITVTFNSATTIGQTILSVIDQTYSNIEYIIVDGQSTDGTLATVEKYRHRISKVISEKDEGLYDAINKGIDAATGDIIAILHSDDFYTGPSVVEEYVKVFEREKCDAVYADLYYVLKENSEKIVRKWKSGEYSQGAFLRGWMPPHPTFFVRKHVYEKYGKFNTDFWTSADYELMLRFIHRFGIKVAYLPRVTVKMRAGGQSNVSVKNRVAANIEDRRAWKVNNVRPKFYTLYLKPLRKILQFLG